jgi:hypothetical protein
MAFALSMGDPPPTAIRISHPDFDMRAEASRMSPIGLWASVVHHSGQTISYACCPILEYVPPCASSRDFSIFLIIGVFLNNERPVIMKALVPPSSFMTSER